jgi:hypothetical protein
LYRAFFAWICESNYFPAMSRSYPRPAPHLRLTKVYRRPDMSIDDIRFKLLERDRLAALDDRSDAARWLGDPPKHRSALAQKRNTDAVMISCCTIIQPSTSSKLLT